MTGAPVIPESITVHLARPDAAAENVTVSFDGNGGTDPARMALFSIGEKDPAQAS